MTHHRNDGMAAETRALAEVIRAALDLPRGATLADKERRITELRARVARVLGLLDYILESDAPDVPRAVQELREAIERAGLGYTPKGDHDDDNGIPDGGATSDHGEAGQ